MVIFDRIWSHLLDLVGERGKTIVITTHYIEEAKQANVVGLLRNGRLLAEDPPQVSQQEKLRQIRGRLCTWSSIKKLRKLSELFL